MNIHQIYTYNDLRNFTYVIALDNGDALVLDPWDADASAEAVTSGGALVKSGDQHPRTLGSHAWE